MDVHAALFLLFGLIFKQKKKEQPRVEVFFSAQRTHPLSSLHPEQQLNYFITTTALHISVRIYLLLLNLSLLSAKSSAKTCPS